VYIIVLQFVAGVTGSHTIVGYNSHTAGVADNPYCNHCHGAYETAAHFLGECERYASRRWEIWESHIYSQTIFNM